MDSLYIIGFFMFMLGMILCIIGVLWMILKSSSSSRVSGGGLVMIGPFPIIFGTSKDVTKWMFIIALIFIAFMVISTILPLIIGGGR